MRRDADPDGALGYRSSIVLKAGFENAGGIVAGQREDEVAHIPRGNAVFELRVVNCIGEDGITRLHQSLGNERQRVRGR